MVKAIYNTSLVTQVLDLLAKIVKDIDASIPVKFEELTANTTELPRLMMTLQDTTEETSPYLSGEQLCPLPFMLTLRLSASDEQERLDAQKLLSEVAQTFIATCLSLDGFVVYTRPKAGVPICLGRTNTFEDWQVTFDLKYIQLRGD